MTRTGRRVGGCLLEAEVGPADVTAADHESLAAVRQRPTAVAAVPESPSLVVCSAWSIWRVSDWQVSDPLKTVALTHAKVRSFQATWAQ